MYYMRIIKYLWLSGPNGKWNKWAQAMIVKCSWLSTSLQSETSQLRTWNIRLQNKESCKQINCYILHLLTHWLSQTHPLNHREEGWHSARLEFDLFVILIVILMKLIQRGLKQELILVLHQLKSSSSKYLGKATGTSTDRTASWGSQSRTLIFQAGAMSLNQGDFP